MIGKRSASTMLGMTLAMAVATLPLFAQSPPEKDAAKPAPAPAAKRKYDPTRRVPDHFGQVGLTVEQRESIYKIRKAHQEKIDALKKQVADHESQSMTECEAVLTETQKKLLENLRTSGGRAATETARSTK